LCKLQTQIQFDGGETLELAFSDKSLRGICESESAAIQSLGVLVASKLKHRLADLSASSSTDDLVAGNPREIDGNGHGLFAIDLDEGVKLVFSANHQNIPRAQTGKVDWPKVRRIKIVAIERRHE
jgi:hypothetical protein